MANKKHVFKETEKSIFFDILKTYSHIVESKVTTATYLQQKKEAWNKIAMEYNASPHTSYQVTSRQLRRLWLNLKQRDPKKFKTLLQSSPPASQSAPPASQNSPPASQSSPPASQSSPPASQSSLPAEEETYSSDLSQINSLQTTQGLLFSVNDDIDVELATELILIEYMNDDDKPLNYPCEPLQSVT